MDEGFFVEKTVRRCEITEGGLLGFISQFSKMK